MFFEMHSNEGQKREEVETNQNKIKSFLQSFTTFFSDSIYHFPLQNYIVFFGNFSRGTPCIKSNFITGTYNLIGNTGNDMGISTAG